MSLKYEIETWASALKAYDAEDWTNALDLFSKIADNSKILTNIGLIYASLGEHEAAVENFRAATELDQYLAIAYFQAGVSNFLLGEFQRALEDFEDAFQFLRGNEAINYEQIGLKYQLNSCSILFNRGITLINLGDQEGGMQLLQEASRNKVTPDHDVIDEAIQDRGEGYSIFSIPMGVVYRPNEKKIANMNAKDYMGKAKLIATTEDSRVSFFANPRMEPQRPTRNDGGMPTSLARSRSAAIPKRSIEDDPIGPPRATNLGRSASAGAPGVSSITPKQPLRSTPPLAIVKSSSTKIPANLPTAKGVPDPFVSSEARRPIPRMERELEYPPSPPRSDTTPELPPRMVARKGESTFFDIYDDYLRGPEDIQPLPSRALPKPASATLSNAAPPVPGGALKFKAEEGFESRTSSGSGVVDERLGSFDFELRKLRVKLYFNREARGMVVSPDITLSEFIEAVCAKFSYEYGGLKLRFEDEDKTKVSLMDEGDWAMALETASNSGMLAGSDNGKSGEGRLSVYCEEDTG